MSEGQDNAVITFGSVMKWLSAIIATLFTASVIGSVSYIRGMDSGLRNQDLRIQRIEDKLPEVDRELAGIRKTLDRIDGKLERLLERKP